MRLFSRTTGSGPDLVLIHGWGMNLSVWMPIVEQLEEQYRITLIEMPGHGESPYDPGQSSLDDWTKACLDVAPARAVWLGWSLGGQLAMRAAMLAPERVERLALVCSSPRFSQAKNWPHAMAVPTLKQFARALQRNPHQTLERFLSLQVQGDEADRETLRLLRIDMAARPEADSTALEHGLQQLLSVDLRESLTQLTCPVLWLLGERDTLVPADVGDELERLVPEAEILILSGSAHAPFLSHTEQCLRALKHFLEPVDA